MTPINYSQRLPLGESPHACPEPELVAFLPTARTGARFSFSAEAHDLVGRVCTEGLLVQVTAQELEVSTAAKGQVLIPGAGMLVFVADIISVGTFMSTNHFSGFGSPIKQFLGGKCPKTRGKLYA